MMITETKIKTLEEDKVKEYEKEVQNFYRDNVKLNAKEFNAQIEKIYKDLKRIEPIRKHLN